MRIAAAYEDGQVFQHFGRTQTFKVYETEGDRILSARIIGSDGRGHGALAELLALRGIDVLICGGIGAGARDALARQGVTLCSGASGSADEAVAAYLRGELVSSGVNCNHHGEEHSCGGDCHGEEHSCGGDCHGEEHSCGGDCHGGEHGCGGHETQTGRNVGRTVRTHYRGTFNDGTQFDSSYDRGEPLEFVCGAGRMIPGFDAAVADMAVGETVHVHLSPAEAYGEVNPAAVFTLPLAQMPGAERLEAGQRAWLRDRYGQPIPVLVAAKDAQSITFDANHEMAGKELNFTIELVEVLD